jgi:DNA-binding IclR family transcriptional regulator
VGVALLDALAALGGPSTLGQIAVASGMSPTRTHRYLLGLIRARLVTQDSATGAYDLGPHLVELGAVAIGRVDAVRLATACISELTERTNLASLICVWGSNGPTVIRWEPGNLVYALRIREGSALPLLRGASGKIFLAYEAPATVRPFLKREIRAWNKVRSGPTAMTMERVAALREEVRRHGLARASGEDNARISAISAPVFDMNGRLALCMTLFGIVGTFSSEWGDPFARMLKDASISLSGRLGAHAGSD